jgi:hypothetical protein
MKHFVLTLLAAATLCTPVVAQNKVKNLYTSSTKLDVQQLSNSDQVVQVSRYFFAGYNTLCMPMSISADQLNSRSLKAERFVGANQEGNVLKLFFMDCTSEGIEAGVPYLIFSQKSQSVRFSTAEASRIDEELKTVRMTDNAGNAVSFGSSWNSRQQEGLYGIPAQQNTQILESILIRTEGDKMFLPTRCGFNWEQKSGSATEMVIQHINSLNELTGINAISAKTGNELVDIYDLKGNVVKKQVKVSDARNMLTRGIYVINGEKVAIK